MVGKLRFARACCAALVACGAVACGGGGGGGGGGSTVAQQFALSTDSLGFFASSPLAATPPPQTVTATFNGVAASALFVRIVVTGTAVGAVDDFVTTGPNSGRMTVHAASPSSLGTGTHAAVITVSACTTGINCSGRQLGGSPATINVAYQIGAVPPAPDAVAPSVGTAGAAGEVVLRGSNFTQATAVSFGGVPAQSRTFLSTTEIHARHPALVAGSVAVALNGGATPFGGTLQLVQAGLFQNATLSYPSALQNLRGLVFDARRQALIVGAGFATPGANQVWRYAFSNGIGQAVPAQAIVANLRDLALSIDGQRLLALTDTALVELNPLNLLTQATTPRTTNPATAADAFLKAIVPTNDGQAVVVSGSSGSGQQWLYAVAARTFGTPRDTYSHPVAGGPDNGARAVIQQGGVSPAQPLRQYSASSGLVSSTSLALSRFFTVDRAENSDPPVFDRGGSRMLAAAQQSHAVYDANFTELGTVFSASATSATASYALSPTGNRAYILELGAAVCRVRAFDLSIAVGPGQPFPEITIGFPINLLPACPASSTARTPIRMLLTPSGDALFIAGNLLARVLRLP